MRLQSCLTDISKLARPDCDGTISDCDARAVQARCQALIKSKPSMADLMKLDADAEQLPGIIPEMAALNKYATGYQN